MQVKTDIPDFIEEKCAAIGQLEPTSFLHECTSERALFVPKQFAFDQPGRNSGAIQSNERAFATRTAVVNGPRKEIGWYSVRLSEAAAADRLWSAAPREFMALHWHGDVFALPSGAVNLASSELTANQAFRYAQSAYGLLFHLEMTEAMIAEMAESFGDELREAGGEPSRLATESAVHCGKLEAIGETVFTKWARLVHEARAAGAPAPQRR